MKKTLFLLNFVLIPILLLSQKSNEVLKDDNIWHIKMYFPTIGELDLYATSEKNDSLLIIKSFENRDKFLLGNAKARLYRNYQKRKYKKSLFAIEIENENGEIHSLIGKVLLKNMLIDNDNIVADIYDEKGLEEWGRLSCKKTQLTKSSCFSMNDYTTICENIIKTTSINIFNPKLTETKNWANFSRNLLSKSSKIYDDLEFLLLFYARKAGFSHFAITKEYVDLEETNEEAQIITTQLNDSTVLFTIESFGGRIAEIDSLFALYHSFKIKILDLRNAKGGTAYVALNFASYFTDDTIAAGAFITRDCLDCVETDNLYPLQKHEINVFSDLLYEKKGIKIMVYPPDQYHKIKDEKIFVLTSKRTPSACEPFVYGLKKMPNVKIIGENTAGEMLSPSVFNIENSFFLIVPTADYLTDEGKSLEKIGVAPSVKMKSEKALDYVLKKFIID